MTFPNTTFVSKITKITSTWLQAVNNFIVNFFLGQYGYVSVVQYGADPTGVADSTAAIQAAINSFTISVPSLYRSGGTIFLPPGTYLLSGSLTLPSGVSLIGAGSKATRLISTSSSPMIVYAVPGDGNHPRCLIAGIMFDGGGTNSGGASRVTNNAIEASGMNFCTVRDCTFTRFANFAIISASELVVDFVVERCFFYSNFGCASHVDGSATTIRYVWCYFSFSDSTAVVLTDEMECAFDNCIFEENGGYGAYVQQTAAATTTFRKCYFEQNGTALSAINNLSLISGLKAVIDDCYFTMYASPPAGSCNLFVGAGTIRCDINNTFFNSATNTSGCFDIAGDASSNVITERNSYHYGPQGSYSANALARIGTFANTSSPTPQSLSYYQEGTFTPTILGFSSAGTTTYSQQHGDYTRIGRVVHFQIYVAWTGATGTGALLVGGIPFAASGSVTTSAVVLVGQATLANTVITQVSGLILPGGINFGLVQYAAGSSTNPAVSNTGTLYMSGSYIAA